MKCKCCEKEHKNENVGCNNSGYRNSGNLNSGYWNSGDWNSGDLNSGYRNSGNLNSGYWNSGYRNSGSWNSGNWNSGNWNSGDWNSGYFNTTTPKVRIFNVDTDISFEEFNQKYNIYADIPLTRWIGGSEMSDEEKKNVNGWEQMGGYLKTLHFKEACQIWWDKNPDRHNDFTSLPHFNAEIFKEITGIDVEEKVCEMTVAEVEKALGKKVKIIKG